MIANVGVEKIAAYAAHKDFDGTLEDAIRIVNANSNLSPEEIRAIDEKVIAAFDRFTDLGGTRLLDSGNP